MIMDESTHNFEWPDYVVFFLTMAVALCIGKLECFSFVSVFPCLFVWLFIVMLFLPFIYFTLFREQDEAYQLLTMVNAGGTRNCVHLHVNHLLYHCVTDAILFYSVYLYFSHSYRILFIYFYCFIHLFDLIWFGYLFFGVGGGGGGGLYLCDKITFDLDNDQFNDWCSLIKYTESLWYP